VFARAPSGLYMIERDRAANAAFCIGANARRRVNVDRPMTPRLSGCARFDWLYLSGISLSL